jgi:hypothetical protein
MTHDPDDYNPCPHGEMTWSRCTICREKTPAIRKSVFISSGGTHFHYDKDCPTLESGQLLVEERGGTRSPIMTSYEDVVRHQRNECKTCVIPYKDQTKES